MIELIYIFIFLIILVLSKKASYRSQLNQKNFIEIFLILIILSIFSGIRNVSMGYDASMYVTSTFYKLNFYNGSLNFLNNTNIEIGFRIFSLLLYKLYPNINFLLFGYSLLTNILVLISLQNLKDKIDLKYSIPIYYLSLYLLSFNIIRQSISISFFLCAFSLLLKHNDNKSISNSKKNLVVIILIVLGCTFHNSSLIALFIFVLYFIIKNKMIDLKLLTIFMIVSTCIIFLLFNNVMNLAYSFKMISEKYFFYITNAKEEIDFNFAVTLLKSFVMFISLKQNLENDSVDRKCSFLFATFALLTNFLAFKAYPIYRCGLYFFYISIFLTLGRSWKVSYQGKNISLALNYFILIIYFIWKIYLGNAYLIYPYKLGI